MKSIRLNSKLFFSLLVFALGDVCGFAQSYDWSGQTQSNIQYPNQPEQIVMDPEQNKGVPITSNMPITDGVEFCGTGGDQVKCTNPSTDHGTTCNDKKDCILVGGGTNGHYVKKFVQYLANKPADSEVDCRMFEYQTNELTEKINIAKKTKKEDLEIKKLQNDLILEELEKCMYYKNNSKKSGKNKGAECSQGAYMKIVDDIIKPEDGAYKQYVNAECTDENTKKECRKKILQRVMDSELAHKEKLEQNFNCKISETQLEIMSGSVDIMTQSTVVTAQIFSNKAVDKTNQDYVSGKYSQKKAAENLKEANNTVANIEMGGAVLKAGIAAKAWLIARKHNKNRKDLEEVVLNKDQTEDEDQYVNSEQTKVKYNKKNKDGSQEDEKIERLQAWEVLRDQKSRQEEVSKTAQMTAMKATLEAAKSGLNVWAIKAQTKELDKVTDQQAINPNTSTMPGGYDGTNNGTGTLPTNSGPPTGVYEDMSAMTEGTTNDKGLDGLPLPQDIGSTPNPGGFTHAPPAANNAFQASGSGAGSGGGGGGASLGGGSGGLSDGDGRGGDEEGQGDVLSGGVSKFASTDDDRPGGKGGKRVDDTGDMGGFNALLEKFLPKKDEPEKDRDGILFGQKEDEGRGIASEADDGSILGPNSNLFQRISNTMVAAHKKGHIK